MPEGAMPPPPIERIGAEITRAQLAYRAGAASFFDLTRLVSKVRGFFPGFRHIHNRCVYVGTGADAGADVRFHLFTADQTYVIIGTSSFRLVTATGLPDGAGQHRHHFHAQGGVRTNMFTYLPIGPQNDEDFVGHGRYCALIQAGDEVDLLLKGAAVDVTLISYLQMVPIDMYSDWCPTVANNGVNSLFAAVPAAAATAAVILYDSYRGSMPGGAVP